MNALVNRHAFTVLLVCALLSGSACQQQLADSVYEKPESQADLLGLTYAYITAVADVTGGAQNGGVLPADKAQTIKTYLQAAKNAADDGLDAISDNPDADVSDMIGLVKLSFAAATSILSDFPGIKIPGLPDDIARVAVNTTQAVEVAQ